MYVHEVYEIPLRGYETHALQMERMDNAAHSVLRPAAQLPDYLYGMGHRRTTGSCACRRLYVSPFWEEMVGKLVHNELSFT